MLHPVSLCLFCFDDTRFWTKSRNCIISTASGALVVGGVRDIYIYIVYSSSIPGDRFECSMEYNQSVSGSQWQSVVVCGSLW